MRTLIIFVLALLNWHPSTAPVEGGKFTYTDTTDSVSNVHNSSAPDLDKKTACSGRTTSRSQDSLLICTRMELSNNTPTISTAEDRVLLAPGMKTVRLCMSDSYISGKKNGVHRGWWTSGSRKFEYTFVDDLNEGVAKEWFEDGTPLRVFNYVNGKEEGGQEMWYADGSIRANYVVRNGRRYGLIGAKPCSNPLDSK